MTVWGSDFLTNNDSGDAAQNTLATTSASVRDQRERHPMPMFEVRPARAAGSRNASRLRHTNFRGTTTASGWLRGAQSEAATNQSGMLSCFFQGFSRVLLRSMFSARQRRLRVADGVITSSM